MPTPIFGIINGIGFEAIGFSKAFTWIIITTISISIGFVGKGKAQETMARFVPPLMGLGSSVVVTTSHFENL